ncbi:hypothetical protein JCM33374_g2433 [Metschnikowia sp. JCM 33374]|nr:hypothetical protein JCM33374_g2433 [Metschnikowia sp. JCM 33374]
MVRDMIAQGCKRYFSDVSENEAANQGKGDVESIAGAEGGDEDRTNDDGDIWDVTKAKPVTLDFFKIPANSSSLTSSPLNEAAENSEDRGSTLCRIRIFISNVATIPGLLKEWYVSKPGKLSIDDRDYKYKAAWRISSQRSSMHKRKKVFIRFMRYSLMEQLKLQRDEACAFLEQYRIDHKLSMFGMRSNLTKTNEKEKVIEAIQQRILAGRICEKPVFPGEHHLKMSNLI